MADFITRVELHNARPDQYAALHAAMSNYGFTDWMFSVDGKKYKLPTAMYYISGAYTSHSVSVLAYNAAADTGCKSWILTAEYNSMAWYLAEMPQ